MANLMNNLSSTQVISLLGALLFLYSVGLAVYRLYFHPLAKIPGPKLAALTRWYEAYYDIWKGGNYTFKISELHKEYGPIIRISPYEVHVNDPDFLEKIFNHHGRWDKYDFPIKAMGNSLAAQSTVDHHMHRKRRAAMNPFFSKQKISTLEPVIQSQIDKLCERVEGFTKSGDFIPIGLAYSAMTMDIITEYTMEGSYGNLDREDFGKDIVDCVKGVGPMWRLGKHMRWLPTVLPYVPNWIIAKLDPKAALWHAYQLHCLVQIRKIMEANKAGILEEKGHKTMFHELLSTDILPPTEKTEGRLRDEVQTTVAAGTETVAHTLRVITYHLCTKPHMLARLRQELTSVPGYSDGTMKWYDLEKLPYLTAVITEGMRLSYGLATRLARIAPDRELEYGGYTIPRGSPVSMTNMLIFQNEDIFPDALSFVPDRWMDPEERRRLDKYYQPFMKGPRNCLGFNLAWAELYLSMAALFIRFDFTLYNTNLEDIETGSDQFVPGPKTENGVRVTAKVAER